MMEHTLKVRLPADIHEKMTALAIKLDRPLAWVVRKALEQYLQAGGCGEGLHSLARKESGDA